MLVRQAFIACLGCTSTLASIATGPISGVPDNLRESATWMSRCDSATIWALVALVCFGLYVYKDFQLSVLSKKVTEAMIKQNGLYESLIELIKDRRGGV